MVSDEIGDFFAGSIACGTHKNKDFGGVPSDPQKSTKMAGVKNIRQNFGPFAKSTVLTTPNKSLGRSEAGRSEDGSGLPPPPRIQTCEESFGMLQGGSA